MEKPVLSYLPADPQRGGQPIEVRFGDLIERRHPDGSTSIWHAVLGNLYDNKGVPVVVGLLRSTETVRVTTFPRHLLAFSRHSDAERCSVFVVHKAPAGAQPVNAAANVAAAPAPPPAAPQAPPQPEPASEFPPGMMSVGMDIDTQSGTVFIHGRQRDSDKDKDNT